MPSVLGGRRSRSRAPKPLAERVLPFTRTLRSYRLSNLRPDLIAGLTTALFTIPQSLAYALIAGFPPAAGVATAVAASIFGALFGASEFVIFGPTNAISVMVAANASLFAAHGDPVQAIVLLTLMVGLVQLLAGFLGAGTLARFVSEPVLTGFTAGAGVYIIINQLPSFMGIERKLLPAELFGLALPKTALFDLFRIGTQLPQVNWATLGIATLTFVVIRLLQHLEQRVGRRLPAAFLAVVLATIVVVAFDLCSPGSLHQVKVVRDIQPLTRSLSRLALPSFSFDTAHHLTAAAVSIAAMGSVESIAIGKVLATRAGHSFDANRQLFGDALCNVAASLVGGFASAGSFSRSAVNAEAGAVTRLSGVLSGVLALALVLVFTPAANLIPIPALAGTLIHVGLRLVDVGRLRAMFSTTTGDRAVLLVTFTAVLCVEHLEVSLAAGVWLSLYFALRRAEGFKLRALALDQDGSLRELTESDPVPPLTVLNLQGELFFAAADDLQTELLAAIESTPSRIVVLRLQEAYNLDATAAHSLAHVAAEAQRKGGRLILCGVRPGMYGTFERSGVVPQIGKDALFQTEHEILASTRHAVHYAHTLYQAQQAESVESLS